MGYDIDETHDPNLESWVESANDPATDFPIQNLPFARGAVRLSTRPDYPEATNIYFDTMLVRIGDRFLDLALAVELGHLEIPGISQEELTDWFDEVGQLTEMHLLVEDDGPPVFQRLRAAVQQLLRSDNPKREELKNTPHLLTPVDEIELLAPIYNVADYTDFYANVFHATNVGSMFRPDNPLLPNYKHIPIAYHGRASTLVPSGTGIVRPVGQTAPAEDGGQPNFGPSKMMDYELEVGLVVGRPNAMGEPISIEQAEDHILGMCLVNDWSARDFQKWEYQPLGPFLAKSFATTVSPYIVTMEALAPFRTPAYERPAGDPQPLGYLDSEANRARGGVDITLEVHLLSAQMREKGMLPVRLSKGTFRDMYWTIAQMLTHHASNGCAMQAGDLLASGTVSGPSRDSRGCLLELTWDGDPWASPAVQAPTTARTPIELPTGEQRRFLEDGDEVILKGYCEREGYRRIGFGECRGIVQPARA